MNAKDQLIADLRDQVATLSRLLELALDTHPPVRTPGAERQRRYRERLASQSDVTRDVTRDVTEVTHRESGSSPEVALGFPPDPLSLPTLTLTPREKPTARAHARERRCDETDRIAGKKITTFKHSDFELTEELETWATTELQPPLTLLEVAHLTEEFIEYWNEQPVKRNVAGWTRTWRTHMRRQAERKLARAS